MSANNLDRQTEERLITEIKDLKRQVSELRTLQSQGADAVNLTLDSGGWVSQELANNQASIVTYTLANPDGKRIFGSFEFDVCQDSYALANLIKSGDNNYADYWDIHHHTSAGLTDTFDLVERILVRNRTGSTKTFVMYGTWRYVVSSGESSTS